MAEKQLGEVYLRDVRLSFPHLFKKVSSVKGSKPRFKSNFLIDPETKEGRANIKRIEKEKLAVEKDFFGKTPRYKDDRCAFLPGEDCISEKTGEPYVGYEGMMVVKAASDNRPTLLDRSKNAVAEEDGVFYGGCRVDGIVRFYGIKDSDKGGVGLFASLEGVMFRKDDEAFGAEPVGADAFDDLDDEDEDDDDNGFDDDDDDMLGD